MPLKHVHGKLMSPDSLWARRKPASTANAEESETTPKNEKKSSKMSADDELDEDIDVDAALRRVDKYAAPTAEADEDEEEDDEDEQDEDEEEDDEEDEEDEEEEEDDDESDEDESEEDELGTEDGDEIVDSTVEGDSDEDGEAEEDADDSESSHIDNEDLTMADKKISMSDHVRNEIEKRKASGASLRGVDIVGALAKRGINVSAAQVSQLLKKSGVPTGKRGRKPKAAAESAEQPRFAGKKAKASGEPRTRREAPTVVRNAPPARVAPRVAPRSAAEQRDDAGLLAAAQKFYAACDHDSNIAARMLRAAEAVHSALND